LSALPECLDVARVFDVVGAVGAGEDTDEGGVKWGGLEIMAVAYRTPELVKLSN